MPLHIDCLLIINVGVAIIFKDTQCLYAVGVQEGGQKFCFLFLFDQYFMALLPKLLIIIIEDRTSDADGIKYFIEMLLDNILTPSASFMSPLLHLLFVSTIVQNKKLL